MIQEYCKGPLLLYQGDFNELQEGVESSVVDACVCDPPYVLTSNARYKPGQQPTKTTAGQYKRLAKGFMGESWDGSDVAFKKETWENVWRLIKPGGYLLAFGGRRTFHRMVVAIEDAGFKINDFIVWGFYSGFPKSHNFPLDIDKLEGVESEENERRVYNNSGMKFALADNGGYNDPKKVGTLVKLKQATSSRAKEWAGWGTDLKPCFEPICVAQKPLEEKTYAKNVLRFGTGGMNINGTRIFREGKEAGWRSSGADGRKGFHRKGFVIRERSRDDIATRTSVGSYWPGNFILGTPAEILEEQLKIKDYLLCLEYPTPFIYCPKTTPKQRDIGLSSRDSVEVYRAGHGNKEEDDVTKRFRTQVKNGHPTVKPLNLMRYLVRLVCPTGGVILDPFMGSGTTGCASIQEGMHFVGFELIESFFDLSKERINYYYKQQIAAYRSIECLNKRSGKSS